jgi:DNA-binding SARP family transcriptional activator
VTRVKELLAGIDHRVMAIVLRLEGLMAGLRGDLAAADAALAEALARAQRHRDRAQQAACERGLGRVALLRNDSGTATAHYERAGRLLEELGDLRAAAEVRISLGYIYWDLGTPDLARRSYTDALKQAERAGYRRVRGFALENLGILDREAGRLEQAVAGLEAALEIARTIDDAQLVALCLDDLAQCRRAMGMATAAEALAQQALAEATRANLADVVADAQVSLAAALLDQGLTAEALAVARPALAPMEGTRPSPRQARALLVAALAARAQGDGAWGDYLRGAATAARQLKNRGFLRAEMARLAPRLDPLRDVSEVADAVRSILTCSQAAAISVPAASVPTATARLPRIALRLLGRPEVLIDGAPPRDGGGHWRLAPTRELFFLLEANREGLTPEQIVDRLWTDAAPGRGQQLFWHYAHRLRAVLGPDALVKLEQRWRLSPDLVVESDLAAFQAAANRVRASRPGSAEETGALAEARRLYTGPYLDGVWADWADRRRAAIESVHRELLRRQVERHLAAGEPSAAVGVAKGLLRAQPLSEEACRLLLRALIAAGQQVNARQVYHRFARRVEERIGAPPAPSIKAFLARA